MKFPRVIQLDDSDLRVYAAPARPGEWAVSGAFAFLETDLERADGKTREAFRHGFLGLDSFGWTTLVEVTEINNAEYAQLIERLAVHLMLRYGAPDIDAATKAAEEEAAFAASICEHPLQTILAVEREVGAEGIEENFRVVPPRSEIDHSKVKIWAIEEE